MNDRATLTPRAVPAPFIRELDEDGKNVRATFICAVASSMKWLRAVLIRDGKVIDQILSPISRTEAAREVSGFLDDHLVKWNYWSQVFLVTHAAEPLLADLRALVRERRDNFHLEVLHGPDLRRILSLDGWLREDPAFRRLELMAYLSTKMVDGEPLGPPGRVLLEWALERARQQALYLEERLEEERKDVPVKDQTSVIRDYDCF